MDDNSPCIVYSDGVYSRVLPKSAAVEFAQRLAAKGQQVWIFKLSDYLYYGGLK